MTERERLVAELDREIQHAREAIRIGLMPMTVKVRVEGLILLMDRCKAALTQQQEAEPAAWFERTPSGEMFLAYSRNPNAETIPLYLHQPKPAAQHVCGDDQSKAYEVAEFLPDGSCLYREVQAAQSQVPEGYQLVREPKPNQNSQSFADRLAYWRTERPSEWLMDEFIRDAQILEAKLAAKEEGK